MVGLELLNQLLGFSEAVSVCCFRKYGYRHPYNAPNMASKSHVTLDCVRKVIESRSVGCLKALVSRGWDVNRAFVCCAGSSGTKSVTALHLAVRDNWCDGVIALLDAGASPNATSVPVVCLI